jgi:DNA-binding CsgD family transcriptional regulator
MSTVKTDLAPESGHLERGHACFARRMWAAAYEALSLADRTAPLAGEDLERTALAAYLIGRDSDYLDLLARAYRAHVGSGAGAPAARAAFWLGLRLLFRGEPGRANGWFGRAQRLLDREPRDCVEQGYLLLATTQQHLNVGESDAAFECASRAGALGERFADVDLVATARHLQGRIRLQQGRLEEGLSLLDECMLAVTAGELSPLVAGLAYCSVIDGCQEAYALGRASEWTHAMGRWCDEQPEMLAFSGLCQVHRAEILVLHGEWSRALTESERALERSRGVSQQTAAAAAYQQAEIRRLRGEFAAAEAAYRDASECGREPQPGLALLRLAQARTEAAAAAMRRVVGATSDWSLRTKLLPAHVEIMLASGNTLEAGDACRELEAIAQRSGAGVLLAVAAQAKAAVELASGNALSALGSLRSACRVWQELDAPYRLAHVRLLGGLCCRALGDEEGAELELAAARALFQRLGAAPDIARLDTLAPRSRAACAQGLTARELRVLRLVAAGKTNKAIAALLSLSEKTIERHMSHILTKLGVPSRTAATAYAYQHRLL